MTTRQEAFDSKIKLQTRHKFNLPNLVIAIPETEAQSFKNLCTDSKLRFTSVVVRDLINQIFKLVEKTGDRSVVERLKIVERKHAKTD